MLLCIVRSALGELDLATRVARSLPGRPRPPARVLAIGKAAPAMVEGAVRRWGKSIEDILVITTDGTSVRSLEHAVRQAGIEHCLRVARAAHPLADERSMHAADLAFELVSPDEPRTILVLISGGASSLVCAPIDGVTLATKREIAAALLASGADVRAINVVRKHLSRIKGGGLLRACTVDGVLTRIASDVVGGTPSDVGSGPTVPDDSSIEDARRILRRCAPSFANVPLLETMDPLWAAMNRPGDEARFVVRPEDLAHAVARALRQEGIAARTVAPSTASAEKLSAYYIRRSHSLRPSSAIVRVAEPAIAVRRAGRGGRSTHLAALVGRALAPNTQFLALATDGVDGASGSAGAIVDATFAECAREIAPALLDESLVRFDTGPLHHRLGTAIETNPTGHNLADLHVLVCM